MQNARFDTLSSLTDGALVDGLKRLIARERDATVQIVAHLAELDTRDVHLRAGYPSLYLYCRDALGLSEWEAYNRIEVARIARRFPIVLDLLAAGTVNLTTVKMLGPHLTVENHRAVLEEARGRGKADVAVMVARLAPRPDVPPSIRRVPQRVETALVTGTPAAESTLSNGESALLADLAPAPPRPSSTTTPLSPDRYKYAVTVGGETLEKIRLAKDMLGHAVPSGDDAAILDRAFTALLAELAKKKFAGAPKVGPRQPVRQETKPLDSMKTVTRTVPAAVKRAVWVRDLGRCAFVGDGGHRCDARRFVEFHHVDPYALGGEATVDGIELRCRRHNDYEGRLYFGVRRPPGQRAQLVPEQVGGERAPAAPPAR